MASETLSIVKNIEFEYDLDHPLQPEKVLLLAILERSIMDLDPGVAHEDRKTAIRWFRQKPVDKQINKKVDEYAFSFISIKEDLQLGTRCLRQIERAVQDAERIETIRAQISREAGIGAGEPIGDKRRKGITNIVKTKWKIVCESELSQDELKNRRSYKAAILTKQKKEELGITELA